MTIPIHQLEYPKAMKGCGYGYAVYHPVPESKLHVGAYGYFDQEGDWCKLGEIDDTLEAYPYVEDSKPFDVKAMCANDVVEKIIKVDAGAQAEPIVSAELHAEYSSKSDFGAVVLARPYLIKHMSDNELFFKRWAQDHFAQLLKKKEILTKYGLWVIMKTCTGPYCAISTFGGRERTVSAGFSGRAYEPRGRLSASGSWHLDARSGTWRTFGSWTEEKEEEEEESKEQDTEESVDPEDVVLFIAGYKLEHKWWRRDADPHIEEMRADSANSGHFPLSEGDETEVAEWELWDGEQYK